MQTVIITGASRGIGAATARIFVQHGYAAALNYLHGEDAVQKLRQELVAMHTVPQDALIPIRADVSDPAQAEALIATAVRELGAPDVLVNNAGIAQQKLFTDITWEEFRRMMDTHAGGVFSCCKAALPHMIRRKRGAVVNVSSMWGVCGASCEVHYSAAKAAVIGMTRALAKEVGPSGITVNCVAPGVIDTDMNAGLTVDTLDALRDGTPLCRIGTAAEVARVIYFLASADASFVTGQVLGVDGGIL